MNYDIAVTLTIVALVVVALSFLRIAPDLILLGGLALLLILGIVSPESALAGFANEGLITVAVLYIVAEGVRQTGGAAFIGQSLLGQPQTLRSAQARVLIPSAVLSTFLNNTPVVAMMVPVVNDWARKYRISVSHLFMPISFAAILGGLCSLIGTSTTLVVNGLLMEHDDSLRMGMFDIALVGVPVSVAGIVYLLTASRWLLPERKPAFTPMDDPREYTVEMIVQAQSQLVGKSIEQAGLRHLPGMYLMEIDRQGHVLAAVPPTEVLQADDRLVFVGVVESIVDLQKIAGLKVATEQVFKLDSPRSERCLIEAVVSNSCPLIRNTIRDSNFRAHYDAVIIAVARNGQRLRQKIGDIELLAGDTLLLEAHPSFVKMQRDSRDFFLVSQVENSTPLQLERAWISQLIIFLMVVIVAFGICSMLKAAMLASGFMLLTHCCRWSDAKRAIDWSVLLVMGAGLGIGEAMKASGAAHEVASVLVSAAGQFPTLALASIYILTMILTNIITAKAAAVLVFPVAMEAAATLNVSVMPFAIVVMIAAAASFATPIGYQTNLMVYGPGGYRFSDYMRLGIPLSLITFLLTMTIVPQTFAWPF